MNSLLKKAFDVEAFQKIKTKIDSDITLSQAYTLSHELKGIKREHEHPWFNFCAFFLLGIALLFMLRILFFIFPITIQSIVLGILFSVLIIFAMFVSLYTIKNYFVYKKHYHQEYTDVSEKLQQKIKEINAKDDAERFVLDLFLQKRGSHLLKVVEQEIDKEIDIEDHIKERLLQELREVFLIENNDGYLKGPIPRYSYWDWGTIMNHQSHRKS
ncbi:MAG TPA: hypothetical protein PLW93_01805 [Candidatus Absconditabacterales bacterium]|nr:hypothetical protein [Candidatus Absconditabacterales bacterium]